jgi:hypothetical protein
VARQGRGLGRLLDPLKPFLAPEKEARAVATTQLCSPLTNGALELDERRTFSEPQSVLIKEAFDSLHYRLLCSAIDRHFLHEGASLKLIPPIERRINFHTRPDPDEGPGSDLALRIDSRRRRVKDIARALLGHKTLPFPFWHFPNYPDAAHLRSPWVSETAPIPWKTNELE